MRILFTSTIAIILFLVSSAQKEIKEIPYIHTIIEFQVSSGSYDSISFYLTKDSLAAYSSWGFEYAYFDSTGYLKLELETEVLA